MDKEVARYQRLEQLHESRKQVARLHVKGHGVMEIVELTGLSYPAVRRAIDLFEGAGASALKPPARGREKGQGRSLSAGQEEAVRRTICDKRPKQLKMEFALWTRGAVMQLIEQQCGVKLPVRAVGNYLCTATSSRSAPWSLRSSQSSASP